jgi:hypothetical protein
MKIVATVMELEDIGLTYIDHFDKVYPSFHTYTLNEFWRETKPIGPPESWMVRANERDAERNRDEGGIVPYEGEEGGSAEENAVNEGDGGVDDVSVPKDDETPD